MNPLDPNTIEQVAGMICDDGGSHYREYWQIGKFFVNAGWRDVPEYDGGGRERWTRELLMARREEPAAIEQVIRRLADPREYPNDPDSATAVATELNGILSFEGMRVHYPHGRPALVECEPAFRTPAVTAPLSLRADLGEIIPDSPMTEMLRRRLDEARTCREYGAYLSSVIMLGSVLEGVLGEVARSRQGEAYQCRQAPKDKNGKPRPLHTWKLAELIDVAHGCGWIHLDVQRFSHKLRDYRNMVHPDVQQADAHSPDEDTAAICWNVVVASLNDLARA